MRPAQEIRPAMRSSGARKMLKVSVALAVTVMVEPLVNKALFTGLVMLTVGITSSMSKAPKDTVAQPLVSVATAVMV